MKHVDGAGSGSHEDFRCCTGGASADSVQKASFSFAPMEKALVRWLLPFSLPCGVGVVAPPPPPPPGPPRSGVPVVGILIPVPPAPPRFVVNIGVSGVGGSPVQLASEEAELEEEVDSMDCFRGR